jgi:hypothetical protein
VSALGVIAFVASLVFVPKTVHHSEPASVLEQLKVSGSGQSVAGGAGDDGGRALKGLACGAWGRALSFEGRPRTPRLEGRPRTT